MSEIEQRPNTVPWPPIIFASAVAAALLLTIFAPVRVPGFGGSVYGSFLGILVMISGLAFDISAGVTLRRHKTTIMPHQAADKLVTDGPYSISRNPIYLGNSLMLLGAGPAFSWPWFLPAAMAAILAVTRLAIVREEAHLAAKFGEDWTAYASRTPRWFGPF